MAGWLIGQTFSSIKLASSVMRKRNTGVFSLLNNLWDKGQQQRSKTDLLTTHFSTSHQFSMELSRARWFLKTSKMCFQVISRELTSTSSSRRPSWVCQISTLSSFSEIHLQLVAYQFRLRVISTLSQNFRSRILTIYIRNICLQFLIQYAPREETHYIYFKSKIGRNTFMFI